MSNCLEVNLGDSVSIPMGNWFSEVDIIPLETSNISLLNEIEKIEYFHNRYYIFDRRQQAVFVFDSTGKFVYNTLSYKGRGPGQYNMIMDITINRITGNLEILDAPARRMLIYNKDGIFIRDFFLPQDLLPLGHFRSFSDDLYLFYSHDRDQDRECIFAYSALAQKVIKKMFMTNGFEGYLVKTARDAFYWKETVLLFSHTYPNNDVYQIDKNLEIEKLYSYDFGKHTFNINALPKNESPSFYRSFDVHNKEKYVFPVLKFETSEFYICFFLFNNSLFLSRHPKHLRTEHSKGEVISAKFKDGGAINPPILFDNTYLYNVIEPSWISFFMNSLFSDKQKKLLESIKEDDNPLLFKYKFK